MNRRSLLLGLASSLAAPAIVRAEILMPVRKMFVAQPDFLDFAERVQYQWYSGYEYLVFRPSGAQALGLVASHDEANNP